MAPTIGLLSVFSDSLGALILVNSIFLVFLELVLHLLEVLGVLG